MSRTPPATRSSHRMGELSIKQAVANLGGTATRIGAATSRCAPHNDTQQPDDDEDSCVASTQLPRKFTSAPPPQAQQPRQTRIPAATRMKTTIIQTARSSRSMTVMLSSSATTFPALPRIPMCMLVTFGFTFTLMGTLGSEYMKSPAMNLFCRAP